MQRSARLTSVTRLRSTGLLHKHPVALESASDIVAEKAKTSQFFRFNLPLLLFLREALPSPPLSPTWVCLDLIALRPSRSSWRFNVFFSCFAQWLGHCGAGMSCPEPGENLAEWLFDRRVVPKLVWSKRHRHGDDHCSCLLFFAETTRTRNALLNANEVAVRLDDVSSIDKT